MLHLASCLQLDGKQQQQQQRQLHAQQMKQQPWVAAGQLPAKTLGSVAAASNNATLRSGSIAEPGVDADQELRLTGLLQRLATDRLHAKGSTA